MNPLVPDFILQQDALARTGGKLTVAALFVDISGFTALTEQFMQHGRQGAEGLVRTLRFHFDPLVAAVHDAGGFITSFAGDAFTAIFPESARSNVAEDAFSAASRMQRFFREHPVYHTSFGSFPFSIRVGISWSEAEWGIVRVSPQRAYWYFHGAAIDACASVEHHAKKGDTLVDEAFRRHVPGARLTPIRDGIWKTIVPPLSGTLPMAEDPAPGGSRPPPANPGSMPPPGPNSRPPPPGNPGSMPPPRPNSRPPPPRNPGSLPPPRSTGSHPPPPENPVFPRIPRPPPIPSDAPISLRAAQLSGAPVLETEAHFLAPGIQQLPPSGEFRNVASVFISFDQAGSLPALITMLHDLSERYGGTFTGLDFGDKGMNCLIHFGAPVSHENDTERALDFALELRKACASVIPMRAGITRDVRYAGFNGGTLRHEFACLGRATNLAARLMMKAPWQELLCDPKVVGDARAGYQFKPQGDMALKGFNQPIAVSSVENKKRLTVQKEFLAKELIGRDTELAQLIKAVEPIFTGKLGGVVSIHGEPGIGKTFLVETYRRMLEYVKSSRPSLWIDAPCDQTLRRSLNPFESALRRYFQQSPAARKEENHVHFDDTLDRLIERLPAAEAPLKKKLDRERSILAALVGIRWDGSLYERLSPRGRFERSLEVVATWISAESALQPVILYLDDVQWADADSLLVLESITRLGGERAIAVVCTARSKDDGSPFRIELDAPVSSGAPRPAPAAPVPRREITLRPLSGDELHRLAENLAGGPISEVMDTLLRENAGGNPFFAEEILGYWLEDAHHPSHDSSVTAPSVVLLPNDVNSLLVARLDRLAAPVKRAVVAAAVLGKEFDLRVLTAMLDDPELEEHVRFAEKQSIWSRRSEILYQFRNTLLRNAAYEMQARARLQQLHLLAAEAIEALFGSAADDQLVALARHYRRAGIRDKAQRNFLAAARQATDRYAHDEAKLLYRSYFRLVEAPTPESVIVRYELARDVLEPRRELDEAMKTHSLVLSEAQQLGDRGSEALAFLGLGRVHCAARRMEPARTCFGHTMRIARQLGSRWMEGQALVHLALCHKADGRLAATCATFAQALAVGREIGQVVGDRSLFGDLALRHQREGRLAKAISLYEQALSIQPDSG